MKNKKYCKYCDSAKNHSEFRIRVEKRTNPHFKYRINKCKECEIEYRQEWYSRKKKDKDWMKKNAERVKVYNKQSGYSKKRWQKNKNNPEWKRLLKQWRLDNQNIVKENQKKRGKKYHEKNRDSVSDAYCISCLKNQFPELTTEEILKDTRLIELKRAEILNFRLNKIINDGKK